MTRTVASSSRSPQFPMTKPFSDAACQELFIQYSISNIYDTDFDGADLVNLNRNNNSSVMDTRDGPWATISRSHGSLSLNAPKGEYPTNDVLQRQSAQHGSLKRRWPVNRSRDRRPLRHGRSIQLKGRVPVNLHQSYDTLATSDVWNTAKTKETIRLSEMVGSRTTIAPKEDDFIIKRINQIPPSNEPRTCSTCADKTYEHRAVSDPFKTLELHTGETSIESKAADQSLQEMFEEVSHYHSVSDIPETLKHNLIQAVCRPLIGGTFSDESFLSRLLLICGTSSTKHHVHLNKDDKTQEMKDRDRCPCEQSAGSSNACPSSESTSKPSVGTEITAGLDGSFTSDFVFQEVFGPSFRQSVNYWQVRPPVLPSHLFRYKTLDDGATRVIGTGTFGEVVAATMKIRGQVMDVVLKEPYSDMVTKDQVFDETKLTMYLEPTGYVPICYGLVQDSTGTHSIVLELFGTGTLKEALVQKTLSRLHWLSVARQLAEGLSRIHDKDVLVNDIKADNVLVDMSKGFPVVKYCDMGCSSYKSGISFEDTNMENFHHLAPEVRAGRQTSKANDVYGLGKLLDRVVQVSLISGIIPVSEACLRRKQLERVTARTAIAMLDMVRKEEERCKATSNTTDSDHSCSDLSFEGYFPESRQSSDSSSLHSAAAYVGDVSRISVCNDLYKLLSEDYRQARIEVYEKLCTSTNLDRICLALFVLLSVILLFCRNT